jgi:hypothetical protein
VDSCDLTAATQAFTAREATDLANSRAGRFCSRSPASASRRTCAHCPPRAGARWWSAWSAKWRSRC